MALNVAKTMVMEQADGVPAPSIRTRLWYAWGVFWAGIFTVPFSLGFIIHQAFVPSVKTFQWWARNWSRFIFRMAGLRVQTHHQVPLDPEQPYIFVSNHQNGLDIGVSVISIPVAFGYAAKVELRSVPFLGWALNNSVCVFVDKSSPRKAVQSIKEAAERIRSGISILLYAEGERTWAREMITFSRGAFQLAVEAGVPVVPVTIIDAYQRMDERFYTLKPGTIQVVVGAPIDMTGKTRRDLPQLMETVRQIMQTELDNTISINIGQ